MAKRIRNNNCCAQENGRQSVFGTIGYLAPEGVLQDQSYDQRIDTYSLGVILFNIVTREELFTGDQDDVKAKTLVQRPKLRQRVWENYSGELRRFVKNLLAKDQSKRMNVSEALRHRWLTGTTTQSVRKD